jgi:transcription antitermination factor NusA-like protein
MLSGLSVSFVVPTDVIGLLIGKSGTFFQETTKVTGTKLYLQSTADMPDLCRERILILVGEKKNVLSAIKLLFKRININRKSSSLEDIVLEKWVIKQADCGHLIGKYGDGIKKINAFSGAWVKVAHVEEYVSESSERFSVLRFNAFEKTYNAYNI